MKAVVVVSHNVNLTKTIALHPTCYTAYAKDTAFWFYLNGEAHLEIYNYFPWLQRTETVFGRYWRNLDWLAPNFTEKGWRRMDSVPWYKKYVLGLR